MTADIGATAYLVDGVDVAGTGVELTHDGAGAWDGLTESVGVETTPGSDKGRITGGVFQPFTLSTLYTVRGNGHKAVWAAVVALRRRCKPGRTVTLTRVMPDPEGTDANVAHTTTARRQTDRPAWMGRSGLGLDIDWLITEPWHGASVNIAAGAGAHTVLGDIRTRRITLTLAAGPARTIANDNGFYVQFLATVPAGGVRIDVEARKATAITGGADLSRYLQGAKTALMQFEAGSNTLTTDAGTFSVDYQPAYL